MVKIAYIMLCHKDPSSIVRQANGLTASGDFMSIHFDASASAADFKEIKDALVDNPNVVFAKRIKWGWGEWSLVQASLNAITVAENRGVRLEHHRSEPTDSRRIEWADVILVMEGRHERAIAKRWPKAKRKVRILGH